MSQLSWTESLKVNDLTAQIDQGFGVLNTEGKIQYVNDQFAEMLGYSSEELSGVSYHSLFKMDGNDFVLDEYIREKEITLLTKNREDASAKLTVKSLDDETHKWYILLTKIDYGDYRLSSDFLKALDSASPRRMVVGQDLLIQYVSAPMMGTDPEEFIGRSALEGINAEFRDGFRDAIDAVFEVGASGSIEITQDIPGEPAREFVLRISPIHQQDRVIAVVITSIDITERVFAEQALRKEESKYRTILEQSLVGIAILPAGNMNIQFANAQLANILGYSIDELQSMNRDELTNLLHIDDIELFQDYLRAAYRGQPRNDFIEARLLSKDTSQIWIELSAGRIEYQGLPAIQVSMVNITKRREMEDGLRESEVRGRTLLQSLHDLVIVHDENDRYSEIYTGNPEIIYTALGDYIGRPILEVLSEDVASTYLNCVQRVRRTRQMESMDYALIIGDERRWFSANMSPHEDDKSVVVVVGDIKVRYVAQEALERERRAFQSIANAVVETSDTSDLSRNILKGLTETLGFDFGTLRLYDEKENVLRPTAIVGMDPSLLSSEVPCHFDEPPRHLVSLVAVTKEKIIAPDVSSHKSCLLFNERLEALNVKSIVVWPILHEMGTISGVFSIGSYRSTAILESTRTFFDALAGILNTIIERKKTEQALETSERRHRMLIESITDTVIVLSGDGKVSEFYSQTPLVQDLSIDDHLGKSLPEIFFPTVVKKISELVRDTLENNVISTFEYPMSGKWFSAKLSPHEDGQRVVMVLRDVSDLKHAEEEASQAHGVAMLYQDITGHDFRNLLQAIMIASDLLYSDETNQSKMSLIHHVTEAVKEASELITSVQSTAALLSTPLEKTSLDFTLKSCMQMFHEEHKEVDVDSNLEVSNAIINADRFLCLMFMNVFSNAVKHNNHTAQKIWTRLTESGDGYEITISDNGPGIKDSLKRNLLSPERRSGGVGILQCIQIANKYGGAFEIHDRISGSPEMGAKFRVWLPKTLA